MVRRRKRRRWLSAALPVTTLGLVGGAVWMYWPRERVAAGFVTPVASVVESTSSIPDAVLAADSRPAGAIQPAWDLQQPQDALPHEENPQPGIAEDEAPTDTSSPPPASEPIAAQDASIAPDDKPVETIAPPLKPPVTPLDPSTDRVAALVRKYRDGQRIEARHELNALLAADPQSPASDAARSHLATIAEETIFSRRSVPGDPLIATYTVKPGDKPILIAREFDVPYEIVLQVNGISDPKAIRRGETLKIPRGPFHARIVKSRFRLDLYLQDLYVRSFPVGLGADEGTPEGEWLVVKRQPNPTYYPPASARDKRVIAADDPKNPLGDYWIGLEGVRGEAVGKKSYGIHGTIEPETIGRNASMGCVRMHNEDARFLFRVLKEGKSTVTIVP